MFENNIWLSKFWVTGSRWEDPKLLPFFLQILNDVNVKISGNMFKMQISTQTGNHN